MPLGVSLSEGLANTWDGDAAARGDAPTMPRPTQDGKPEWGACVGRLSSAAQNPGAGE